jgi:hypothetical protein
MATISPTFSVAASGLRDSAIECRQHLVHQQLDRRQAREAAAIEHEVVDAELDERPHLLDDLRGGADDVLAHLGGVLWASP